MNGYASRATGSWILSLVLYALLAVLYLIIAFLEGQHSPHGQLVLVAIKLIPLLCFLPGLILRRVRAYIWLCFVLCLYLIDAVSDAALEKYQALNIAAAVLVCGLFTTLCLGVRWQARHEREEMAAHGQPD
ncbi:MAG: DUF2069 domain-containing protein [Gammaproteobacteria bacterium]|nr:MAG: DUF2069 domain-containing protein [Gammaproteobacteria bacterium]